MYWRLHDCQVPAKHLLYKKLTHADFVTGWKPGPPPHTDLAAAEQARVSALLKGATGIEKTDQNAIIPMPRTSFGDFADDLTKVLNEQMSVKYTGT